MEGLCVLCKELITNPLSIETVGQHIGLWLPEELRGEFRKLHAILEQHLRDYQNSEGEQLVCIHCYVREVYQWLKRLDRGLAGRFLGVFSFGYSRKSFESHLPVHLGEEAVEDRDFGLCDECGEYNDALALTGGEWMCEECSRYG